MGSKHNLITYVMEQAALQQGSVPGHPIVEISGDHRVLIENHQGIAAYGKEQILVNVKFGIICVCGCKLEILRMTKEQVVIHGSIHSVVIQRRSRS
jgi:sporulation protein YqfC